MNNIALQKKFKHIIKKILPENIPESQPFSSRFPTRKQWFFLPTMMPLVITVTKKLYSNVIEFRFLSLCSNTLRNSKNFVLF